MWNKNKKGAEIEKFRIFIENTKMAGTKSLQGMIDVLKKEYCGTSNRGKEYQSAIGALGTIQKVIGKRIAKLERKKSSMCGICMVNENGLQIEILRELHGGFKE